MIHQSELPPQAAGSTGHYVADHAGYYWQAYTRRNQALGNGCRVLIEIKCLSQTFFDILV